MLLALSTPAVAQPAAAAAPDIPYLSSPQQKEAVEKLANMPPGQRDRFELLKLMPLTDSGSFAQYVQAQRAVLPTIDALLGQVDALRLNKIVANAPGASGTSLLSRVAAPLSLGAAVEYGSILQEQTNTATTLRANALGLARMLFGTAQYQYCPQIAQNSCSSPGRFLRRVSASVSFEAVSEEKGTAAGGVDALLGDDYRVATWSARLDLTPSNNLDDPGYVKKWQAAIDALKNDPASKQLVQSITDLFRRYVNDDDSIYSKWSDETIAALQNVPAADFAPLLERRVRSLVGRLEAEDPEFAERVTSMVRAYQRYYDVRDSLLREAQSHKSSLEAVFHRPKSQPTYSHLRYVYSHQPTSAPAIMTLNAAVGVYDSEPAVGSRFRDLQFAGQVDRRLGDLAGLGASTLTFAVYYQWMKEDALIVIGDKPVLLPGTGIPLPEEAAPLLRTKGHIGAAQAKLAVRLGEAIKLPVSVTWASRKELIDESEIRGQVGFTFDLDQLLH
jgi:hypothetical protein